MKILVVCSGNARNGKFVFEIDRAFIHEQIEAIKKEFNVEFDIFLIKGRGIKGYIKNYIYLLRKIKSSNYDLIHAHYGLSGLISVLQFKFPVVVTFHGSDINNKKTNLISSFVSLCSKWRIFVSQKMLERIVIKPKSHFSVIPCGVNVNIFHSMSKREAKSRLDLSNKRRYILFSSGFDNKIKNYPLAKSAVEKLNNKVELLELKNFSRSEVNLHINACDLLLMTSFSEGSPQVVKEAMACNCPIVSTDVGDVKEVIENTKGCYITSFEPEDVAEKIKLALDFGKRTNGRQRIIDLGLDSNTIAKKIFDIYTNILKNSKKNK